ncbi:hypothetical protein BLOT_010311 [Blomia tropicalis]|nr:hypothetical protein BLOT_010311 [Blomia tropicalis]
MNFLPGPIYVRQQSQVYQQLTQTLKLFDQMVDYMEFNDKEVVQKRLKDAVKKGVNMNGAPLETLDFEFNETWIHIEHDGPRPPPTEQVSIEAVIGAPIPEPEPEPSPLPSNYNVPYQMVSPEEVSLLTVPVQTIPGRAVYYHGYVAVTNYVPSYLVVTRPITPGQPATTQVVPLQDIPGFTPSTPNFMPNQTIAFITPLNQNNNQDESNQNMSDQN